MKRNNLKLILIAVLAVCLIGGFSPKLIAKAEHNHNVTWNVSIKPTFTENGLITSTCDVAGCELNATEALSSLNTAVVWTAMFNTDSDGFFDGTLTFTINDTQKQSFGQKITYSATELASLGYATKFETEPTLTSNGVVSFKNANNSEIDGLVILPNLSSEKWTESEEVKATCEGKGQTRYTYASYDSFYIVNEDVASLGHNRKWVVTTQPTSTENGEAKYMCVNDGCGSAASTMNLKPYSSDFTDDENYHIVINRPIGSLVGTARIYIKDGATADSYSEDFYFDVEMPTLVVESFYVEDGNLYIKFTNGQIDNLGKVQGADGINGTNGSDGTNGINGVNGSAGKDGINGVDGADGKDGINGANGKDGKDGADGKSYLGLGVTSIIFGSISIIAVGVMIFLLLRKKVL